MQDVSSLVGYRFPGGAYHIAPHRHWLACDAIGADPRAAAESGVAHPLFTYYAAIGGMGMSLAEFFELCGCGPDSDQPMLGETTLELEQPLRIGDGSSCVVGQGRTTVPPSLALLSCTQPAWLASSS